MDEDLQEGELGFDFRVDIPSENHEAALLWVRENGYKPFIMLYPGTSYFFFQTEKAAMHFKLVWGCTDA